MKIDFECQQAASSATSPILEASCRGYIDNAHLFALQSFGCQLRGCDILKKYLRQVQKSKCLAEFCTKQKNICNCVKNFITNNMISIFFL